VTRRERQILHQAHPAKLAADISGAMIALVLFWRNRLITGLLVALIPPLIASALTFNSNALERFANAAWGNKLRDRMTALIQSLRLFGFAVMGVFAWLHSVVGMVAGLFIIFCCWFYVLYWPQRRKT
jgi:hypothetical protein